MGMAFYIGNSNRSKYGADWFTHTNKYGKVEKETCIYIQNSNFVISIPKILRNY